MIGYREEVRQSPGSVDCNYIPFFAPHLNSKDKKFRLDTIKLIRRKVPSPTLTEEKK